MRTVSVGSHFDSITSLVLGGRKETELGDHQKVRMAASKKDLINIMQDDIHTHHTSFSLSYPFHSAHNNTYIHTITQ